MKKILGSIKTKSRKGEDATNVPNGARTGSALVPPQGDSTEAVVVREVIAFCESGAPGSSTAGEEYLHLPAIVDGAESSPTAAKEAAVTVRKYLGREQFQRGFAQYNAIMLMRILTDNPGRNFTQNFDKEFISTIKKLLRETRDSSVQQIMRETLDHFEAEKAPANDSLNPLIEMWRKEKGAAATVYPRGVMQRGPMMQQQHHHHQQRTRALPPPGELAARIEEAKTTARLLLQTIQSTPSNELATNELVKEFAQRAKTAQRSIQGYMGCEDPRPDDDTMLTLIETNEQLNIAMSKHQRSLLQARKTSPSPQPQLNNPTSYMGAGENVYTPPSNPPQQQNGFFQSSAHGPNLSQNTQFQPPPGPPPGARTGSAQATITSPATATENPFTDPTDYEQPSQNQYSLFGKPNNTNTQASAPVNNQQSYNAYNAAPTGDPYASFQQQARPGGYPSTQSYMNRQESASNNLTMHGASPPPR